MEDEGQFVKLEGKSGNGAFCGVENGGQERKEIG